MANKIFNLLIDSIFPPICFGCDGFGVEMCWRCINKMVVSPKTCCYCQETHDPSKMCVSMKNGRLESVVSLWKYEGVVAKMIKTCKYQDKPRSLSLVLQYLRPSQLSHILFFIKKLKNPLLVPVPLHKTKYEERGFDQVAIAADILSLLAGVPVIKKGAVLRLKKTNPQASIKSKEDRLKNVVGAFFIAEPNKIRDITPVIVDDVLTTGATISSLADEIFSCSSKKSHAIVVAHEAG